MKKRPASRASAASAPAEVPVPSAPAEVPAPSAPAGVPVPSSPAGVPAPLLKRARSQRLSHFQAQANSRIFGNLGLDCLDISDSDDDGLILPASFSSRVTSKARSVGSFKQAVVSCALLGCCTCLLLPLCLSHSTISAQLVQVVGAVCAIGHRHRPLLVMFDAPDSGEGPLGMEEPSQQEQVKAEPVDSPVKGSLGLQAAAFVADQSPAKEKDVADESLAVESSSASGVSPPVPAGPAGVLTCPLKLPTSRSCATSAKQTCKLRGARHRTRTKANGSATCFAAAGSPCRTSCTSMSK